MHPVQARDLTVVYRTGILARPVPGLAGLDLAIEAGAVFGYVGANGAGKTTTIKTLLGLIRPTRGEALLFGIRSRDPASRREVGFLPESPYFYEYLTGTETVEFYARLSGLPRAERNSRAGEVLERVGLTGAAARRVGTYSRGMRQRLGLAQAIVHRPKLLILDEPMSGLDPMGRRDVRELIRNLARAGATVFFSSHILSDIEALCDRVGVLAEGRLVAVGTLEELTRGRTETVELRAKGVSRDTLASLNLGGDAKEEAGVLTVELPDNAAANRACRLVIERGGEVLSLMPVQESLEDVFERLQEANEQEAADD